ncbi:MAG: hypothetical protein AAF378_03640 [Cyanobacteria bacterium P01_A01_bin.84]
MPSASPGRYQSKLFNFFHRQSRRLNEQFQHRFRQLKVNVTWSAEALLYPLYKLLQKTVESAGKQLQSQEPEQKFNLLGSQNDITQASLAVDAPVSNLLLVLDKIQFSDSTITSNNVSSTNSLQTIAIQGIACDICPQKLVLVSGDNHILDILSPLQQEELQKLIILEIAKYWRSWRLSQNQTKTRLLPKINDLLTKFKVSKLLPGQLPKQTLLSNQLSEKILITGQNLLNSTKPLTFLDTNIAKLESHALVPVSQTSTAIEVVKQKSFNLLSLGQQQLNIFLYGREQALTLKNQDIKFRDIEVRRKKIELSSIKNLISAAISYFFDKNQNNLLKDYGKTDTLSPIEREKITGKKIFYPNIELNNENNQTDKAKNLWLTLDDLFGNSQEDIHKPSKEQKYSEKIQKSPLLTTPLKNNRKETSKPTVSLINQNNDSQQIEHQPDWIETKAQLVRYNKHPLEQLLEWLDNTMLFLEETSIRIFKFFQSIVQRKK